MLTSHEPLPGNPVNMWLWLYASDTGACWYSTQYILRLRNPHVLRCMKQPEHSMTLCLWQAWAHHSISSWLVPDLHWCSAASSSLVIIFSFLIWPARVQCYTWVAGQEGGILVTSLSKPRCHLQIVEVTGGCLNYCLTHALGVKTLHQMSSILHRHLESKSLSFFSWLTFKCYVSYPYSNVDGILQ